MTLLPTRRSLAAPQRLLVSVALLLLVIPGVAAQGADARLPAPPGAAPRAGLYVSNPATASDGQSLTALDPRALQNLTGMRPIPLGPVPSFPAAQANGGRSVTWILSADGSTLLGADYARTNVDAPLSPSEVTFTVRDGLTGAIRAQFPPPGPVVSFSLPLLSADGSRIAVMSSITLAAWYVMETATGRAVAEIRTDAPRAWGAMLDPAGRRLYVVAGPNWANPPSRPMPLRIVAYDASSGAKVGETTLPEIPIGVWRTAPNVQAQVIPGIALSPDGRTLAVVHPERDAVTLIATDHMSVARTIRLHRSTGWLARLAALLPLAPQAAAAKVSEGVTLDAVFAADGHHLYVTGFAFNPIGTGSPVATGHALGLLALDLRTGTIVASALSNQDVRDILPAPDGRSVYVFYQPGWPTTGPWRLQRLDATTLAPRAAREFPQFRSFVLRPAVPGAPFVG